MKNTVKENVNSHLDEFELNMDQFASLNALEKSILSPTQKRIKNPILWSVAASLLVVSLFFTTVLPKGQSQQEMIYAIAQEVSYNHLKFKPLEVTNNNLTRVTGYFEKLDFNPLASSQVAALSSRLIGGRYCSIKGNIAAQLRMRDEKGAISTLFESRFNAEDFDFLPRIENQQAPVKVHVDGQQVRLWVEKGLVMALVNPISK
ncbi:MAG: hypothetical protein V7785_11155 [Bermanella sp.]